MRLNADQKLRVVITGNGYSLELPLSELVPALVEEVKAALRDDGFISRIDIDAAEARRRDLARRTLREDRCRVVR